jgi:hypothetical protein
MIALQVRAEREIRKFRLAQAIVVFWFDMKRKLVEID